MRNTKQIGVFGTVNSAHFVKSFLEDTGFEGAAVIHYDSFQEALFGLMGGDLNLFIMSETKKATRTVDEEAAEHMSMWHFLKHKGSCKVAAISSDLDFWMRDAHEKKALDYCLDKMEMTADELLDVFTESLAPKLSASELTKKAAAEIESHNSLLKKMRGSSAR